MPPLRTLFRDAYFSLDRRVLGCFRIAYGTALLYDLLRRAWQLRLLYSNDGILSNHYLLYSPQVPHQFSIYTAFSTPEEVTVAFALTGLVYTAYTVGLFTRAAQILALICLTSLNARNLFFEDGGMSTMIALAVWTAFMPLGDRYSIDAIRCDAALATVRERVLRRKEFVAPFQSLAVLAIVLQILTIYSLNVVHKGGVTWHDGSAVHYVLWQNRVNTIFGNWLAHHEPSWFSPLATRGTLILESAIPVLVLVPVHRALARTVAWFMALSLHGGIALMMTLGPFSYAMICLVSLMLPPEFLRAVLGRTPQSWRLRALRLRARFLFVLRKLGAKRRRVPRGSPAALWAQALSARAREALVAFFILINALEVAADNHAIRRVVSVRQPEPFATVIGYLRMIQSWNMFAPDAPEEDGMAIIDARTLSGGHVDPFTGQPPNFELGVERPVPHSVMLCDYLFAMKVGNEAYRPQLANYLSRWHTLKGRPSSDQIVSYQFFWASHHSPVPGSLAPFDFRKELVFSGP